MENLRQRTVSGLSWNAATQILAKAFQFVVVIVLARLLSPDAFGLVGMVSVFIGLISTIADFGLGTLIVQKQTLSDADLSSAHWLSIAIGTALTVAAIAGAPLLTYFYGEPRLRLITDAVAFNFILVSLSVVQYALLQKALDFRRRFWIETVAISCSGIVGLVLALTGAGVWSLIGKFLCEQAVRTMMTWCLSPWRPQLVFERAIVKELVTFGRTITGFHIVIYCAQNFDKLVIGREIGSSALGVYSLSDRLMRTPLNNITAVTGAVMFPALSTLQNNIDSMKRAYLRANRMIALVTFPMMLGLIVIAEPAILLIYGQSWGGAVGIVKLLCLAGLVQSVYNTASWIFLSFKRADILFRLSVLSLSVRIAGVLIGMRWGLPGIAAAYVFGSFGLWYPTWSLAGGLIGLRFREIVKNVVGPFYCAAFMAGTMWNFDRQFFFQEPHWIRLLVLVLGGTAIYAFLIMSFKLEAWQDAREFILETAGRRSRLVRFVLAGG